MVCATNYSSNRGNYSGCFPFAFSRHLAPFGAPSQRPHCRRNNRMRWCPCKMNRVLQVPSGSDSGHTCSVAVTHIEFCATRYRTRHCIFPPRYHSVNQSPIETPLQQPTVRSARREMIWILRSRQRETGIPQCCIILCVILFCAPADPEWTVVPVPYLRTSSDGMFVTCSHTFQKRIKGHAALRTYRILSEVH